MTKRENRKRALVDLLKKGFRSAPEAWLFKDELLELIDEVYEAELARRIDWGGRIG